MKNRNQNKGGFTLAELLIVVAIIGVLVAVAIPIFSSQLSKAKASVDMANIRSAEAAGAAAYLSQEYTDANNSEKMGDEAMTGGRAGLIDSGLFKSGESYSFYIYDPSSGSAIPWYGKYTANLGGTSEMAQLHAKAKAVKGYTKCAYTRGGNTIAKGKGVVVIAVGDKGDIITGIHLAGVEPLFSDANTFWADVTNIKYQNGTGKITY